LPGLLVNNEMAQRSKPALSKPGTGSSLQDCLAKWEESVAHSILARSTFTPLKAVYICANQPCPSHFSLASRRRTIHSGFPTSGMSRQPLKVKLQIDPLSRFPPLPEWRYLLAGTRRRNPSKAGPRWRRFEVCTHKILVSIHGLLAIRRSSRLTKSSHVTARDHSLAFSPSAPTTDAFGRALAWERVRNGMAEAIGRLLPD